ncbi:MAG TPA: hypothetical protein VHA73_04025 [Acidimicrobiales bacterium]|jgi:hypothetical protein|nr:hypothetical protein [Acidimicrobiales bacterium]
MGSFTPSGPVVTGPIPVIDDPTGMSAAVLRLSPASYHSAVPSLTVAASRLDSGEHVELVAQGMFNEVPGIVMVTDRRVAIINGRQWQPDIVETIYVSDLVVQGWQDHQTAALAFTWAATRVQIDRIFDVPIAHDIAKRVRERVASVASGPPA